MYADRNKKGLSPTGMGAALVINAGLFAVLMGLTPNVVPTVITTLTATSIEADPPPPPPPPPPPNPDVKKPVEMTPKTEIFVKPPIIDTKQPDAGLTTTHDEPILFDPIPSVGEGTGGSVVVDPPKPPPVLVDAQPDARAEFQPDYPADMRRAGMEGAVVVRVLIGTDGRVKQVELVRSPSDSFFDATKRQALSRWRFKPATSDGVPVEKWRTMTLRFRLTDA